MDHIQQWRDKLIKFSAKPNFEHCKDEKLHDA